MPFVSIGQTELPFLRTLCFAGAVCDLRTNSSELAQALERLLLSPDNHGPSGFSMWVVVDESSYETVAEPHFCRLHDVVIASFGRSNTFVLDILRRRISASISTVVARDDRFWKKGPIPLTLGVLGSALGLVPVYCLALLVWREALVRGERTMEVCRQSHARGLCMTNELCWHPDLFRRFVPTPYVFSECDGPKRTRVESNDLEIALGIRRSDILQRQANGSVDLLCKLIRDVNAPVDDSEISIVSDEALRVLYVGRGTILNYDQEKLEILGFISRDVEVQKLVLALIPALLDP